MKQFKLCLAQRCGRRQSVFQPLIQRTHQARRGFIAHLPQRADDIVCARAEKRPRQADEALSNVRARSAPIAGGDRDQARADRVSYDVARVKLE